MIVELSSPVSYVKQEKQSDGTFAPVKYEITELEVPESFTVGEFRAVKSAFDDSFNFAAEIMQKNGLPKQAVLQLNAGDLVAYFRGLSNIFEVSGEDESEAIKYMPKKFVFADIGKVKASQQLQPYEWACQVIEYCGGFKRSEIDALPAKYILVLMPNIADEIFSEKK